MGSHVALVKGNLHMGFQVDRAAHILWFRLKEVARWDLGLTKKKREKGRKKRRKRRKKQKRKKVKSLHEWILSKLRRQVFLYKAYYAKH